MGLFVIRATLLVPIFFFGLGTHCRAFISSPSDNNSIFIVLSYSEKDLCGRPQLRGILQALNESPHRYLEIRTYYLHAKKLPESKVKERASEALDSIKKVRPRIVITVDDVAFLEVGLALNKVKNTQVVFTGINGDISSYNKRTRFLEGRKPISNITGVLEHLFLDQQVDFLKLIGKSQCTLAILYSADFMGEKGRKQISKQLRTAGFKNAIRYFSVSNLKELDEKAQMIDQDQKICAYFPVVLSISDKTKEKRRTLDTLVTDITSRIHKIDIAVNKSFTKAGFFGGANVDMFHMGYQAGQMAGMLFDGVDIAKIPVEDAERFQVIINKKRARDLGIELKPDVLCLIDELI